MKTEAVAPKPCPFCGKPPKVSPQDPAREGNAWGEVRCVNGRCPSQPVVRDGISVADERGPGAYKRAAIRRWNRRVPDTVCAEELAMAINQVKRVVETFERDEAQGYRSKDRQFAIGILRVLLLDEHTRATIRASEEKIAALGAAGVAVVEVTQGADGALSHRPIAPEDFFAEADGGEDG